MPEQSSFCPHHLLLIPGALALAAWLAQHSGIDRALTAFFYDARQCPLFRRMHRARSSCSATVFAKDAVTVVWLGLLAMR